MYTIEKNVPIPEGSTRGPGKGKLLLTIEQMEVGDSIVITGTHREQLHAVAKRVGILYKSKTIMKSNTSRKEDKIRVWRTG